jgi:hypothetical protein
MIEQSALMGSVLFWAVILAVVGAIGVFIISVRSNR